MTNVPNALITMRISYKSLKLELSTGCHIDSLRWNEIAQVAVGPNRDGMTAEEINARIMTLAKYANDVVDIYESASLIPTPAQFKDTLERLRMGKATSIKKGSNGKKVVIDAPEAADKSRSKSGQMPLKTIFNINKEI